jgi:hypothetical protein
MVHLAAGDLALEIDYGCQQPRDILQRFEAGRWTDYRPEGRPVVYPFDIEALEPGRYRLSPSAIVEIKTS